MRKILAVVAIALLSSNALADCTNIASACTEYKQYVMGLSKPALAKEVGKQLSLAYGNCMKDWTLAGAQAVWSGLSTSYVPDLSKTVEPCLEHIGRYTHSTNYLFYGTFDPKLSL